MYFLLSVNIPGPGFRVSLPERPLRYSWLLTCFLIVMMCFFLCNKLENYHIINIVLRNDGYCTYHIKYLKIYYTKILLNISFYPCRVPGINYLFYLTETIWKLNTIYLEILAKIPGR